MNSEDSLDPPPAAATMVIRYWREREHPEDFRARLSYDRGSQEEPTITLAGNAEQVVLAVREWLASLSEPST